METFKEIIGGVEWVINWYFTEQSGFLGDLIFSVLFCYSIGEIYRFFMLSFIRNGKIEKVKKKVHRLGSKTTMLLFSYAFLGSKCIKSIKNEVNINLVFLIMTFFVHLFVVFIHDILIIHYGEKWDDFLFKKKHNKKK